MVTIITRDELKARMAAGDPLRIVEALPPLYYDKEHLPGALNMPHDQIDQLAPSLLPDQAIAVVVYCANGPCQNSGIAAARLAELGYAEVYDYALGKQDWAEAGLPLESGSAVPMEQR